MKKKILFIMNPISGTASKAAVPSLIDSVLDKELFEYEIRMTERAGHASEIATEAKNNHVDVVVAVGGDGTVNEVARSLVHSDTALGQRIGKTSAAPDEPEEMHRGHQPMPD